MLRSFKVGLLAAAASVVAFSSAMAEELNFYNWTDYTSPELIKMFEEETGIKVNLDTYDSNETLLAKLQSGATGYDVAVPSQNFVEIMIKEGLIQKFGASGLSNYGNLHDQFQKPAWDAEGEYTVPFHWGSASMGYRKDLYGKEVESWGEFFEPGPELAGKLQVFRTPDEVLNLASLYLGVELCTEDPADAAKILALFEGQKPSVLLYSSENMTDRLATGETIMANTWNGDSMKGRMDANENISYAYPKEGVIGWFDSLVIPTGATNVEAAKKFIDFHMRPDVIALSSNFARYSNAVKGSDEFMDDEMKSAPEMVPPADVPVFASPVCSPAAQKLVDRIWTKLFQ
jgi:spermidine/putrescine transport system substrate-binding protein